MKSSHRSSHIDHSKVTKQKRADGAEQDVRNAAFAVTSFVHVAQHDEDVALLEHLLKKLGVLSKNDVRLDTYAKSLAWLRGTATRTLSDHARASAHVLENAIRDGLYRELLSSGTVSAVLKVRQGKRAALQKHAEIRVTPAWQSDHSLLPKKPPGTPSAKE